MSAAFSGVGTVLDAACWCVLLALALFDLRHRRLPLALTRGLIALGLLAAWVVGGVVALACSAAAALLAAMPLVALRKMLPQRPAWRLGGGDVRLAAGLGSWLGLEEAWLAMVIACALAVAAGLALGAARRDNLPFGSLCAAGALFIRLVVV